MTRNFASVLMKEQDFYEGAGPIDAPVQFKEFFFISTRCIILVQNS